MNDSAAGGGVFLPSLRATIGSEAIQSQKAKVWIAAPPLPNELLGKPNKTSGISRNFFNLANELLDWL